MLGGGGFCSQGRWCVLQVCRPVIGLSPTACVRADWQLEGCGGWARLILGILAEGPGAPELEGQEAAPVHAGRR